MKNHKDFCQEEDGAVTVDWVVLTGAVVGVAMGMVLMLANGSLNVGNTVESELGKIADRVESGTDLN